MMPMTFVAEEHDRQEHHQGDAARPMRDHWPSMSEYLKRLEMKRKHSTTSRPTAKPC